jgi:hypothetical protein
MTLVDLLVQIVLGIVLTATVVRRDMRRLPPERYVRSWNEASFWSAVVAFGPLCIPVHFIRTRRSLVGALLGVAWMAGVLVVLSVVGELLAAILD